MRGITKSVVGAAATAVVLVGGLAAPASGITFGQPDGGQHPNVGSLLGLWTDGNWYQWCTGTLVPGANGGPAVFLTAAHCTDGYDDVDFKVTFDEKIDPHLDGVVVVTGEGAVTSIDVTARHPHPEYGTGGANDTHDVAVLDLAAAPAGVTPAQLPTQGMLDDKGTRSKRFTTVGYGTVRDIKQTGPQAFGNSPGRLVAEQSMLSLTKAWLTLSMNPSTGSGGTCYGDSGGPHFLGAGSTATDIVVSVTVTGDSVCRATDKTYRLDTAGAREFLGQYVALP